jgi:hypothetical protein
MAAHGIGMAWRFGMGFACAALGAAVHAATVGPSNQVGSCDIVQSTDLTQTSSRTFNTGTECATVVAQSGLPELCVIRFRQITIGPAATIQVTGNRLLVLIASSDFVVQGSIDLTGSGIGAGLSPGGNGLASGGGAAGAGGSTQGGTGGSGGGMGASGPNAISNPRLVPLVTGSRGGAAGSGGAGGSGGGAVQLVACGNFLLDTNGTIRANGLGGLGGAGGAQMDDGLGGAGGGSGGGVLIEGDDVDLLGLVVANGGGGGGGGSGGGFASSGNNGGPGGDGSSGTTPAVGGTAGNTTPNGGGGGSGGSLAQPSDGVNGAVGAFSTGGGGGGGGSPGRIRINACTAFTNGASVVSPTPTTGSSCDGLFANSFE